MKRMLLLVLSGLFEVVLFVSLQLSAGFTELYPALLALLAAVISYFSFQASRKQLSPFIAYGVHLGIALVGIVFCSLWLLDEKVNWIELVFLWLTFLGIIGFYGEYEDLEQKEW